MSKDHDTATTFIIGSLFGFLFTLGMSAVFLGLFMLIGAFVSYVPGGGVMVFGSLAVGLFIGGKYTYDTRFKK